MSEEYTSAIKIWEQINLGNLQKTLDEQGLKIIENQKETLASRKQLAEQTREFKKLSNEEKLTKFKVLLKSYQNEIDNITKRSKVSETAYLNVYQLLLEAPDPSILLSSLMEQNVNKEEYSKIEKENEQLKEELKNVNNDYSDYKIKNSNVSVLKQQVTLYETKLDELVNKKVIEKENEMKNIIDEKIRLYKEREHSLQRQLNQYKDQIMALQDNHDVTQAQIIDHSQKYEEEVAAKLAELEIVMNDLENSNIHIAKLQQENKNLKQQLSKSLNDEEANNTNYIYEKSKEEKEEELNKLRKKCQSQDEEVNHLMNSLQKQKNISSKNELIFNSKISSLQEQLKEIQEKNNKLQEKLDGFSDYKKIKKELEVLKFIEFSGTSAEISEKIYETTEQVNIEKNKSENESDSFSLEKLIMAKNKKMQTELTEKKVELENISNSLDEALKNLDQSKQEVKEKNDLISKLEEDLLNLNSILERNNKNQNLTKIDMENNQNQQQNIKNSTNFGLNEMSNLNHDIDIANNNDQVKMNNKNNNVNTNSNNSNNNDNSVSILPILASQRDRYRQRNQELEQQIRSINEKNKDIELEVQSLKNDNVKLYEKIRYMQSMYKPSITTTSTSTSIENSSSNKKNDDQNYYLDMPSSPSKTSTKNKYSLLKAINRNGFNSNQDVSEKYKNIYEDSLNPFNEFRGREENRRYNLLNPMEKASLFLTKIFLANKYSRIFFMSYIIGLHLLVIITIFKTISFNEGEIHQLPLDTPQNH